MLNFLYNLSIYAYVSLLRLVSPFNKKAKLWVEGRKNLFDKLKTDAERKHWRSGVTRLAWFHCASLGEFEQGRPVIEAFRKEYPNYKILLTFFSPSGYEIRKNYTGADYIYYLPADTPENAASFVEIVKPSIAFFVKYEFWNNYLTQLQKRKIPVISFSAIFRPNQVFFKFYGGFYQEVLHKFDHILVQNTQSLELLEGIGIANTTLAGDTRFDRVKQIVDNRKEIPVVEQFKNGKQVFIIGSAWQADMDVMIPLMNNLKDGTKFIVAPHEIHDAEIEIWRKQLSLRTVLFSDARETPDLEACDVLFINNIGLLSSLYQYAEYAFIGGSFGKGLHNILEAATFGMPIFFGNKAYHKFQEANDLIAAGGAFPVENTEELKSLYIGMKTNEASRKSAATICSNYVTANVGATQKILEVVGSIIRK
ncbi:3-deoxy-D-manno-octulosonic acid transferase [Emticicia sp. TH156]|uniref:3-deoxy-D-manno-octulosonic acid transferase n=1 Tax=Emticicia sp. TH156 TaxID=2067454 RepID=UPI000C791C48|nr:glycosyltransferase N-terminal domain-containing protein [Emticicia sp. TH156]PLK46052.1 3-deoxy-D-manno-octulosonic acid transferase [Emticicia sp. TH156]